MVPNRPGPFGSMGLAGCTALVAVNFTHPIETVKTRMQIQGSGFSFSHMMKTEGSGALYKGIQAAWLREASYTTVKLGGYGPIKSQLGADGKDAPFYLKFLAGSMSGSIGTLFGNPFDVMKTMMMGNPKEPIPITTLASSMMKEQGLSGFYRGVSANIMRACVLNGTKMSCYDQIKGYVQENTGWARNDVRCQFSAATAAGFLMTCTVAPFDFMRTTLMNQPMDRQVYKGFADCFVKILKADGPFAFYRGFFPIWGRFAPQATLQLIIFEKFLVAAGFDVL